MKIAIQWHMFEIIVFHYLRLTDKAHYMQDLQFGGVISKTFKPFLLQALYCSFREAWPLPMAWNGPRFVLLALRNIFTAPGLLQ